MENQQNKDLVGKAADARNAVADFGRRTVDTMDAQRQPAAATIDHTASALQQQADRVTGVANAAADRLRTAADYVRNNDMKAMGQDVQELVRRYPGQALVAAAVLGFFVARAMRSRT